MKRTFFGLSQTKTVAAIIVALAISACASSLSKGPATLNPAFDRTTTHDIAECAEADDQPVCILRALANFPTHSPYSTNWRLAGASDVLAALGEAGTGRIGGQYSHIPYASTQLAYGYLDAADAAVAAAIVADRRGAPVEQALALVVGEIGVEHLRPGNNTGAYCMRLSDIWRAYGTTEDRANRPNTPRPSSALVRAAIATCDQFNAPADAVSPQELARRYAQLGDLDAARRVMARDTGALARGTTALIVGDWSALAEFVSAPTSTFEQRLRAGYKNLRAEALTRANEAGESRAALSIARSMIDDFIVDESEVAPEAVSSAVDTLVANGERAEAARYLARLEPLSRDATQSRSILSAGVVVRGWVALGETARARALVEAWTPRCSDARPYCSSGPLLEMYTQIGAFDEGWRIADRSSVTMYLSADFVARRGLQNLDGYLDESQSERRRVNLLLSCTELGRRNLDQLAIARTCAERLLTRAADVNDADNARRGRNAATAALNVSERAARLGEAAIMEEMLAQSFVALAAAENAVLTPNERRAFLEIAIFQLERAGRL